MSTHSVTDLSLAGQGRDDSAFHGAKLAVFVGRRLLTLLRDDKPDIPFPAHWDMIGGGREGGEAPAECVLRECLEETGVAIDPASLVWGKRYEINVGYVWFFVAQVSEEIEEQFVLQDEGQMLEFIKADEYLTREMAIPRFQSRLADYIAGVKGEV